MPSAGNVDPARPLGFCLGTTFALSWIRLHAIRRRAVPPGLTSRAFGAGLAAHRVDPEDGVLDHQPLLARDDDLRPARGAALLVNGNREPGHVCQCLVHIFLIVARFCQEYTQTLIPIGKW